jgi:hypothetical protein
VVVLAAAIFAVTGGSAPADTYRYYLQNETAVSPAGSGVTGWAFAGSLPVGWHAAKGVFVQRDGSGLYVRTPMRRDAATLSSPVITLAPGRYRLVAGTTILVGGLRLDVRDADTTESVAQADAGWVQSDYSHDGLAASFTLDRPARLTVTVRNWTPIANASAGVIDHVAFERIASLPSSSDSSYYRPRAAALARASVTHGTALEDWPFTSGTPQGWSPVGSPEQTITPKGLDLRTTPAASAYQLTSQAMQLEPGRYALAVGGRVLDGGIELGVLDNRKNAWITTRDFWSGQRFGPSLRMTDPFRLRTRTSVRFLLANWAARNRSSEWLVHGVDLIKLP